MDPRVLLVAAVVATGLLSQQAPQQPTFRTRAELVRVDVTVLDRNDKPLPNLTVDDFTILQDGVPRRSRRSSSWNSPAPTAPTKT